MSSQTKEIQKNVSDINESKHQNVSSFQRDNKNEKMDQPEQ